jgi:hypothetical protein
VCVYVCWIVGGKGGGRRGERRFVRVRDGGEEGVDAALVCVCGRGLLGGEGRGGERTCVCVCLICLSNANSTN